MPNKKAINVAVQADHYDKLRYIRFWTQLPIQSLVHDALSRYLADREMMDFLLGRQGPGPVWLRTANPSAPPEEATPGPPLQLGQVRFVSGSELAGSELSEATASG